MRKEAALPFVLAFALALSGCGGDGNEAAEPAGTTTATTPDPTASSAADDTAAREVAARTSGGTLSGHCSGEAQGDTPPFVLESGMAEGQGQLAAVEEELAQRTVVCAYDRAGVGDSHAPAKTPRPVSDLVADLESFVAAAKLEPPVFLVGQSAGATVVFMYAQAHPDDVAGFVSMNPVPPSKTFLKAARKVESKEEFAGEQAFYSGENDESVNFSDTEQMLEDALPPTLPYAVMFDEDCGGDADFCGRILPALTRVTKSLASRGDGGRFVRAKDAGHNIFESDPELVFKTIADVLSDAPAG